MPAPLIIGLAAIAGYILGSGKKATVGAASMQVAYPMDDSEGTRAALERYANAMAQNNADWFKANPDAPCCAVCAGVGYVPPQNCKGNPSCQAVLDAPALLAANVGTCFDLAAYNAGHYLSEGKAAEVRLVHAEDAQGELIEFQYHAIIVGPKGIEDPAKEIQEKAATVGGSEVGDCFWTKDGFGNDRYCCVKAGNTPGTTQLVCVPLTTEPGGPGAAMEPATSDIKAPQTAIPGAAGQGCGCG